MPVAFLSRPNQPPAIAVPALRNARPDRRPRLLVARPDKSGGMADLRARLATMGIAARALERGPGDPIVAVWLMAPEEYTSVAAWSADLLLLGGGWALLEAILDVLERAASASRRDCVAELAGIRGVWAPVTAAGGPPAPPLAADRARRSAL